MPIAFYRTHKYVVRVYGFRARDVIDYCLALQEARQRLSFHGTYRHPLGTLFYAEVHFGDNPELRDRLPPVGTMYGDEDVLTIMRRAGVRMVHELGISSAGDIAPLQSQNEMPVVHGIPPVQTG